MFLIILHLLQYFLEDFFIPLGRVTLFVQKESKLAGEFAFEVVVEQGYFSRVVDVSAACVNSGQVSRESRFAVVAGCIDFSFGDTQLLVVVQGHLPAGVKGQRLLRLCRQTDEQTENSYDDTLFHCFGIILICLFIYNFMGLFV